MNVCCKTDIGLARSENQDRARVGMLCDDVALAVVCDGMGGENAGSEASEIAVNIIYDRIQNGFNRDFTGNSIRNLMISAVNAANSVIYDRSSADMSKLGMGTTCVAAVVVGNSVYIVNVGDSRAYLIHDSSIKQLTCDHTIVNMLLNKGEIEKHEMKTHPQKNIITKAVGVGEYIEPDYFELDDIWGGFTLLLCTDGLSSYCEDEDIYNTVTSAGDDAADALIGLANSNGGRDNITIALVIN